MAGKGRRDERKKTKEEGQNTGKCFGQIDGDAPTSFYFYFLLFNDALSVNVLNSNTGQISRSARKITFQNAPVCKFVGGLLGKQS